MDLLELSSGEAQGPSLSETFGVVRADFNGDGMVDLAVITPGGELVVLLAAEAGLYRQSFHCKLGGQAQGLYAADLDGDGVLDLAVQLGGGQGFNVLRGKGDGTFSQPGGALAAQPTTWSLTPREHEVARLAAGGYTCKEIAGKLGISRRTAESHVEAIRSKLELKHKRELVHIGKPPGK